MKEYDKNLLQKMLQEHALDFVVLFGSYARGQIKKTSDIDIAIKKEGKIEIEEYSEIQSKLAKIFNVKDIKIGLVEILHLSPILMWQIAKYGQLLAGNPLKFKKNQLYALKKYLDTKKFRNLTKRYIFQNLYAQ